jgi:hypothetical protein
MQAQARRDGVIWLSVISSAPGQGGYVNGPAADVLTQSRQAAPTDVLLDPSGTLGRLYGAKTTPQLFVIDKHGALQYMGGVGSMAEALAAVEQGKAPPHALTKPDGCSIPYSPPA